MTFYQELQLNQSGSKAVIKAADGKKEKAKHIAIYLFKIVLTVSFCTAFVMAFDRIFGSENSIVGVVMLLCVLSFRFADLGICTKDAMKVFPIIFAIMAFGPRLANACGLMGEFAVNAGCIMMLMVLGCHNVIMFNHSTLVLGYLLLYGYDTTAENYIYRLAAIGIGAVITMAVYFHNHHKKQYKRTAKHLFQEFDLYSSRTRWQLKMALVIASAILFAGCFHIPRRMWVGIAAMSVTMPFEKELCGRMKGRIWGNFLGGIAFLVIYFILPESMYSYIGIIGGIGVGLSASYGWQAVFNSFGAMSIATSILGLPGAILYRVLNNVFGSAYGWFFEHFCGFLRGFVRKNNCADCN